MGCYYCGTFADGASLTAFPNSRNDSSSSQLRGSDFCPLFFPGLASLSTVLRLAPPSPLHLPHMDATTRCHQGWTLVGPGLEHLLHCSTHDPLPQPRTPPWHPLTCLRTTPPSTLQGSRLLPRALALFWGSSLKWVSSTPSPQPKLTPAPAAPRPHPDLPRWPSYSPRSPLGSLHPSYSNLPDQGQLKRLTSFDDHRCLLGKPRLFS